MIHDLKILPEYFIEVVRGNKTFEVRKDDRPFNVGDELMLYEVNCGRYTGRNIKVIITYILRNPNYCKEGYCILGFKQPVVYAHWIELPKALNHNENPCKCSNCGHVLSFYNGYPKSKYCDTCGARMKGESNENKN